jgi:septum formation protein
MKWIKDHKIILASGSPRRAKLLKLAGFEFVIRPMDTDEDFPIKMPTDKVAEHLAEKKALAQKHLLKDGELLIAADTVVIQDDKILGKPVDKDDARQMLRSLSNAKHKVITGVCILSLERNTAFPTARSYT